MIGLMVSAPVGPLGILCIQRTLNRGRWHGVVTGLGATTSDLIYALAVAFSMNYIVSFIDEHRMLIQIGGSVIIFLFGIYIFLSNPVKQLKASQKSDKKGSSYFSDYASAFGLCFSNPLIMFLFIGLFARFNFISTDLSFWQNALGLLSVLIGAFSWWLFLTMVVGHLRSRFNLRGLWILNRITGSILMLFGVAGVVMAILGISI